MADWYCSADAPGGGDGSSGSPWTLAEGNTAWGDGTVGTSDRLGLKSSGGVYTTVDTNWTGNGVAFEQTKTLTGCTNAIGDGGKATIQRSGGAGILVNMSSLYVLISNFIIDGQDSGTDNLKLTGVYIRAQYIESHSAGGLGINGVGTFREVFNCYLHDNASYGTASAQAVANCIGVGNGQAGIHVAGTAFNCIGKGSTGTTGNIYTTHLALNCISDGGTGDGIQLPRIAMAINCIAINSPAGGKYGINLLQGGTAYNCDFYGNDDDINVPVRNINGQTLDPQFNDPDTLDYTRTGTNLDDLGFSEIGMLFDYNIDIGPDQKAATVVDYPAEADVEDGVVFDSGAKTGNFEAPAEDDVRDGIGYGAGGAEFEGNVELPSEAEVESGVGFGANGTEFEGSLVTSVVQSPVSLEIEDDAVDLLVADDRILLEVADG